MRIRQYFFVILFLFFAVSASADTLDQNQSFFISPQYDAQSRTQISATLKSISNYAYFYVEDGYWDSASTDKRSQIITWVTSLGREFDERIYPTETQFFGSEPNPGIDNNPRVTILLSPLIENAGGYFDTANSYLKSQAPNSNEREMIYLNVTALGDQRKMNAFLAHEFQHLISFNQKEKLRNVSDNIWLNELRSEYAVTLLGYNDDFSGSHLERRLQALIGSPSDSLTEWKNLSADYGQIGLFGEYLAEHWSPKIIADSLNSNYVGIMSLNEALKKNGFSDSFADIFGQWSAANILNDISVGEKFGYTRDGLKSFRLVPTKVLNNLGDDITFAVADSIKDWQSRWYDVSQFVIGRKNVLKINFSSSSLASFYISYLVFKTDGSKVFSVFNPTTSSNILYIDDIGENVSRMIFMPIKKDKISGFTSDETPVFLAFSVERAESVPQGVIIPTPTPSPTPSLSSFPSPSPTPSAGAIQFPLPGIPDGSLIRAEGDYKVYVVNGRWRRHIISSKIFSFYPQFGFEKVKVVTPSVLAQYQESDLIRFQLEQKVFSVDELGAKHWLNMSARQFTTSNRAWDSIFVVNLNELNFYEQGTEIRN